MGQKYGQHGSAWFGDQFIGEITRTSGVASTLEQCLKALAAGEEVAIRADGSMEPTIQRGDFMIFTTTNMERVRPGDIILYRAGGMALARRVCRKSFVGRELVLEIKADASSQMDASIRPASICAVLKGLERKGKAIPARRLRGGFVFRFTDYGSLTVPQKLLRSFAALLPRSMRPGGPKKSRKARKSRR